MTIFFENKRDLHYINPISRINKDYKEIYLPIDIDTEFQQPKFPNTGKYTNKKTNISVQIKGIRKKEALFFLSEDMERHKIHCEEDILRLKTDFAIIDFIRQNEYACDEFFMHEKYTECYLNSKNEMPILKIDIFGFFLVADLMRLFKKSWKDVVTEKVLSGEIEHRNRLNFRPKKNKKYNNYIEFNKYLSIEGIVYRVFISVFDLFSLQGKISYKDLCKNTNIICKYKENIEEKHKGKMLESFLASPKNFIDYAKGDTMNYEALLGHINLIQKLYEELGLVEYYRTPKSSIGTTVFHLLESSLLNFFGIGDSRYLKKMTEDASYDNLSKYRSSTRIYLGKTNGGRCYNNRPIEPSITGSLVDVDIKGCYSKGLKHQDYPLGKPIVIDYSLSSEINHYQTLREFLRTYEKELVDGLWYCRISTSEELSFDQDFFTSWYPPNKIQEIFQTDFLIQQEEEIIKHDHTKIYSREIHLGVLQSDSLEWIQNYTCKQEREELLDKIIIIAAAFHPKSLECKTREEFQETYNKRRGKNYCKAYINNKERVIIKRHEMESYSWCRGNIGDIYINKLIQLRESYDKEEEQGMNELIKLIINTTYGDLVSPYFYTANTIVGNNITARGRAMAWYMEKALHGTQTITDGCAFDINKVVKSRYKLTNAKYFNLKYNGPQRDLSYGQLMTKKITQERLAIVQKEEIEKKVNRHIRETFQKAKVVKQYEIGVKEIFTGLATHGSSNYQMYKEKKIIKTKMRSYKNDEYINIDIGTKKITNTSTRTEEWLNEIYKKPNQVNRQEPFVEEVIVKTKNYKQNEEKLKRSNIEIGDTDQRVRMIHEFNISMFLFRTHEQYLSWEREHKEIQACFQQSYESNYQEEDGKLNYIEMIKEIQIKIREGKRKYYKQRSNLKEHPKKSKYDRMKIMVEMR